MDPKIREGKFFYLACGSVYLILSVRFKIHQCGLLSIVLQMAGCDAPPKKEYIKADKTITVRQHQEKLEAWFEERDSRDIWQLLAACRSAVNIFSLRNSPTHPITFSCGHAHTLQRCREGSCLQILQIRNCSLSIRLTTSR